MSDFVRSQPKKRGRLCDPIGSYDIHSEVINVHWAPLGMCTCSRIAHFCSGVSNFGYWTASPLVGIVLVIDGKNKLHNFY